jgi:hypothetical protein
MTTATNANIRQRQHAGRGSQPVGGIVIAFNGHLAAAR